MNQKKDWLAKMLDEIALSIKIENSAELKRGIEAFNIGKYRIAFNKLAPLAEAGNAMAQTMLGLMYQDGKSVPQDYVEAVKWFRRAAQAEYIQAQYYLAIMYAEGKGVARDNLRAYMWLYLSTAGKPEKAAEFHDEIANRMTREQIAEAKRMAEDCRKKNYKDC